MKILILNGHDNYGNGGAESKKYGSEQKLTREFSLVLSDAFMRKGAEVTIFNPSLSDISMYSYLSKNNKFDFSKYDRVVELHFNSGVIDIVGNGKQTGTEILLHKNPINNDKLIASRILKHLASIGLRSRGIKIRSDLRVMNTCYAQGISYMRWEICFIGDADDMIFYTENMKKIAETFANEYVDSCNVSEEWFYVDTDDKSALNIRKTKDISSRGNIIGSIPNGLSVKGVKEEDGKWTMITFKGITGYVVSRFLKNVKRGKVSTPNGGRLHVRRTPTKNGYINGKLNNGSDVYLYGCERNESGEVWRAVGVNIGEISGYSLSEYLVEND